MTKTLLPLILKDKNNVALEECMKHIFNINVTDIMIKPLESATPQLFPYLAKEEHILGWEGWNLAKTTEEKKNLIVNSLQRHSQKGSIPSIKNILKDFNIEAEVYEFWQYGGRPGHYILKFLNLYERGLTDELRNIIYKIITSYAPKSRILDYINYFLCSRATFFIKGRVKTIKKINIKSEVIL